MKQPKPYELVVTLRVSQPLHQALEAYRASLGDDVTRSEATRQILADWLRTHGFSETELRPTGLATNVVAEMDAAIKKDRTKAMSANNAKPQGGKRQASVKETGEEVPPEQWERFEAADKKPRKR